MIFPFGPVLSLRAKLTTDVPRAHYLSGPLRIVDSEGVPASPGDLLAVEICNLGPLPGDEWGYTAILERENGGGFLTDHFPSARKAIWYFEGIYAYSPQIPGNASCWTRQSSCWLLFKKKVVAGNEAFQFWILQ